MRRKKVYAYILTVFLGTILGISIKYISDFGKQRKLSSEAANITNEASRYYQFQVDLDSISLNGVTHGDDYGNSYYRIIVGGHIYGKHFHDPSPEQLAFPSQTLMRSLSEINYRRPDLFVSLGDMVRKPSDQSFSDLSKNFLVKVDAPMINAPGNHDLSSGRELYEVYFGQTYFYTKYFSSQIIVLDTELANCYIAGRQLEMLNEAIQLALNDDEIRYIFIFLHKLIYLDPDNSLGLKANDFCHFGSNYVEIRDELLFPAALEKPIYLIAGDVGAFGGNLSPFYAQDENYQLYTIAVGLGNSDSDVLLQVDLYPDNLEFGLIPLGNKNFLPLESYTPEYWSNHEQ